MPDRIGRACGRHSFVDSGRAGLTGPDSPRLYAVMNDETPDERGFLGERPMAPPLAAQPEDKPHYHGHRERLRQRFEEAGAAALSDYEMLELLLFRSIPRADTKGLAKALLKRFGTFGEVLGAPERLLREVPGCGAAVARDHKIVAAATQRMLRSEVTGRQILSSWSSVID